MNNDSEKKKSAGGDRRGGRGAGRGDGRRDARGEGRGEGRREGRGEGRRGGGDGRRGGGGRGRDDRGRGGRGRGRDDRESGQERALSAIKASLPAVDRPVVNGDFDAQVPALGHLRDHMARARLKSLDDLGHDLKGRVLTLLLKVGRQTKVQEDEEKEAARQKALGTLARVWMTVGDERRAAAALAAAGNEDAAEALLEQSGDWRARVALLEATGDDVGAARLLEKNGELERALAAFARAGDDEGQLRILAGLGDMEKVAARLAEMDPKKAEAWSTKHKAHDAWARVLTERKDWVGLGRLYTQHGQHAIAARAFEEAGRWNDALKSYTQAGDGEGIERAVGKVVEDRLSRNDILGAAGALVKTGHLEKAAEIAAEKHPEKAHAWLVEAGYVDKALDLARREARKAEGHDDYKLRAMWLSRAGDHLSAATLYEGLEELDRAQIHYEKARAWEPAARCAERRGDLSGAVDLYYRAGLNDDAERVKLLA